MLRVTYIQFILISSYQHGRFHFQICDQILAPVIKPIKFQVFSLKVVVKEAGPDAKRWPEMLKENYDKGQLDPFRTKELCFTNINTIQQPEMKLSIASAAILAGFASCQSVNVFTTIETLYIISTQGQTGPPTTRMMGSSVVSSHVFLP